MSGGGVTPEPLTPFIKIPTNLPPTVYAGEIKPYQNNEFQILIYGNDTTGKVGIFNDVGTYVDDTQQVTSELESYIKQIANEKSGVVVTGFDIMQSPVDKYQILPDWDKYI